MMKFVMMMVVVVVVTIGVVSSAKLPMPRLNDEERKLFLSDMDKVVDCLMEAADDCHPYTEDVRRVLPDLIQSRFRCNCDAQRDVDLFREYLSLPQNKGALKKLLGYITKREHLL